MITSARNSEWPLDVVIENLDDAGLPSPSMVRMKLFALDDQLIVRKIGHLSVEDQGGVRASFQQLFTGIV